MITTRCFTCGLSRRVPEEEVGLPTVCLGCGTGRTIMPAADPRAPEPSAPEKTAAAPSQSPVTEPAAAGRRGGGHRAAMLLAAGALVGVGVLTVALAVRSRPDVI